MKISFATANLYKQPFGLSLDILAEAGFEHIELDLFWERKQWAVAQHLKDVPIQQVVQQVEQSGLRISSIHDGGGVLEERYSAAGFINPALDQILNTMSYAPECLVFHTPHIEGNPGAGWWQRISDKIVQALDKYRKVCALTIENMPLFEGYSVPLISPEALRNFVAENGLGVTFDTTHYAQMGIDIVKAAKIVGEYINTIHLSDFIAGRTHVFIGEGELDFPGFIDVLDKASLNAITLECSLVSGDPSQEQSYPWMVSRAREARSRLDQLLWPHF